MKRIKLNIFRKTFILTVLMLLSIIIAAYLLIYFLFPQYYKNYKTKQYDELVWLLTEQISDARSRNEESNLLYGFAMEENLSLTVFDENDEVIYEYLYGSQATFTGDEDSIMIEETSAQLGETEDLRLNYSYTFQQEPRNLQLEISLQSLTETAGIITDIYPAALALCLVFSFILASIFSGLFVKPIKKIRKTTEKMSRLEPDASIPVTSSDEIGAMSQDINQLYEELRGTIVKLEEEITRYSDAENEKIDFLRTVSHELKTPLASANALVEGIIWKVPPYDQNQTEYLSECKSFLDKAIQLTKESLSLSNGYKETDSEINLKDLVDEIFSSYRVILRSKQIEYEQDIPSDILITTRINIFTKALSNIFSNAANYTNKHGKILVKYTKEVLTIENTCIPTDTENNPLSTGLGLHIVEQLFTMLKIRYTFEQTELYHGMKFTIFLSE